MTRGLSMTMYSTTTGLMHQSSKSGLWEQGFGYAWLLRLVIVLVLAYCMLIEGYRHTKLEDSYFRGGCIFRSSGNREGNFSDDLTLVLLFHDKGPAEGALHFIDCFDRRRTLTNSRSYSTQLINVESHMFAATRLRLICEDATFGVVESLFAIDGFVSTSDRQSPRRLCHN